MQVIYWNEVIETYKRGEVLSVLKGKSLAVTVGSFDGLHLGHKALVETLLKNAKQKGLARCAVTFVRPTRAKKNGFYAGDILSLDLKLKMFKDLNFDFLILIDFSTNFATMSGEKFFEILVKTIHMKSLFVGQDFACGFRHSTRVKDIENISETYAFSFDSIECVKVNGLDISSSSIRNAVKKGNFAKANKLLGYSFLLDLSNVGFEQVSQNELKASTADFSQVLPDSGEYEVELFTSDGFKQKMSCTFTSEFVLLRDKPLRQNTSSDRKGALKSLFGKKLKYLKFS
ncbi:MAG: FAD synthetase family protein [Treponemataceae bacterium]